MKKPLEQSSGQRCYYNGLRLRRGEKKMEVTKKTSPITTRRKVSTCHCPSLKKIKLAGVNILAFIAIVLKSFTFLKIYILGLAKWCVG